MKGGNNMEDKLTPEQVELLNSMCFGAHEVKLGNLLLKIQEGSSVSAIEWHSFTEIDAE